MTEVNSFPECKKTCIWLSKHGFHITGDGKIPFICDLYALAADNIVHDKNSNKKSVYIVTR